MGDGIVKVFGALRVKNEARWIDEVISSLAPVCDHIILFDDHSTDDTPRIAKSMGCEVIDSPYDGLDEVRDKNHLLAHIMHRSTPEDWCLMIDGDEVLQPNCALKLRRLFLQRRAPAYKFRILYLWNDRNHVRTDGVYGRFYRASAFQLLSASLHFAPTGRKPNFHCGNVPHGLSTYAEDSGCHILHLGYMNREDRLLKYAWYTSHDPNNAAEDNYRHMVIGDLFQPNAVFRHGGPLVIEELR